MQFKPLFLASIIATSFMFMGCPAKIDDPTTTPDINTFTISFEMAYKTTVNANPKCFIDFDKGMVYDVQNAPPHAADIDAVWTFENGNSNAMYLFSMVQNQFSTASNGFNAGELGLGNWSVRNNCILEYDGHLAKGQVTDLKTAADLKALVKSSLDFSTSDFETFDGTSATFAKIYTFETNLKKRGAFIVNSNDTDSNGGRANITIKIEK